MTTRNGVGGHAVGAAGVQGPESIAADRSLRWESFDAGDAPHRIHVVAVLVGADLCVTLGGGPAPHVGALALGVPRPSLADPSLVSASVSVLTVTGHKEDELARSWAHALAAEFDCRAVVSAGIHIDGATGDDLRAFADNCADALALLRAWLRGAERPGR